MKTVYDLIEEGHFNLRYYKGKKEVKVYGVKLDFLKKYDAFDIEQRVSGSYFLNKPIGWGGIEIVIDFYTCLNNSIILMKKNKMIKQLASLKEAGF